MLVLLCNSVEKAELWREEISGPGASERGVGGAQRTLRGGVCDTALSGRVLLSEQTCTEA